MLARTYSVPVLADSAAVLAAQQLAGSKGMPSLRQAGVVYGTSLAYDLILRDQIAKFVPSGQNMAMDVVAKAAAFTLSEALLARFAGEGMQVSLKSFLINGAGLVGSSFAQPMLSGRGGVKPGVSSVAQAARQNPLTVN